MINPNQIKSSETWQEAFDRVKRAVDEYHTKFWEELEKMTKIDEAKQYKFSEIVRMVEDKELPEGTLLKNSYYPFEYEVIKTDQGFSIFEFKGVGNAPKLCSRLLNFKWAIKLPKEDKYYLKAPEYFERMCAYLNYDKDLTEYSLGDKTEIQELQTKFTQSEIDAMPFDTSFFKQIKVEDEK